MWRLIGFIFFATICIQGFPLNLSQKRIYIVKDSISGSPISNVHIRNHEGRIIAYTNKFGEFNHTDLSEDRGIIKLSCVGYQTLMIDLNEIKGNVIEIVEEIVYLNEVMISPITAKKLVAKCIEHIEENYLIAEINSKGNVSVENIQSSYDGIVCDLRVQVKREGKYEVRKMECNSESNTQNSDLFDLVNYAFAFDHVINERSFLNLENMDSWKYDFVREVSYNDDILKVVSVKYIIGSQTKKSVSHYGLIYINERDYSISKIEYHYEWIKMQPLRIREDSIWYSDRKWIGYAYYAKKERKYEIINLKYDLQRDYYKNPSVLNAIESKNFIVEYKSDLN